MNRIRLAPLAFAIAGILAAPASALAQQVPVQQGDAAPTAARR
ncbi:hypothetical protein RMA73_06235 [Xanthomonas translucens pv. translucens]|nr:hypothetical protein [Xanthomonas translucens]WNJ28208.1 hypothetical protein RMA73_06235 [Xanthomonas translucens pv. translucens]